MEAESLISLIEVVGLPIGLLVFFLMRLKKTDEQTAKRETALGERVEKVENGVRTKLEELTEGAIEAVTKSSGAIDKNSDTLDRLIRAMGNVPCITDGRRLGDYEKEPVGSDA